MKNVKSIGACAHSGLGTQAVADLKRFAPLALLLVGLGLSGRIASGQVFVYDQFTDAAGTSLASHAPNPGPGGTWAANILSSTIQIQNNQAENVSNNSAFPSVYVNSATPSNATYVVQVTGYWPSGGGTSTYSVGVVSRASIDDSTPGDPDRYQAYLDGGGTLTLNKRYGGALGLPSSCATAAACQVTGISLGSAPFSHIISMVVTGTASPVTITVYVDGALKLTATDSTNPLTSAGYAGIRLQSPANDTSLLADNYLASSPLQLAITSVSPASPTTGVGFSVTVQAQVNGTAFNVVNATNVSLSLYTGTGTLGGTLTGTIAAGSNSVTISGVTYTKAESGVALTATETSGDTAAPGNSASFTVQAGTPTALLVFTKLPSGTGTSLTAWALQPVVTVEDSGGHTITGYSTSVTLGIYSGTGTLTCTTNPVTPVLGVATFAGCSLDKATTYTLMASSGSIANSTTNPSITISAGTPAKLAFLQQPSNAAETVTISPAVTVQIQDQAGNLTTSTANVTLAIGTNPGGGTLTGGGPVAAVSGTATFSGLSIDKSGAGYTLTASSTGLTGATSGPFNITGARYSVATGNWSSTATWSTTSGGPSGAPVPTATDAVIIERGYTVTDDVAGAVCLSAQLGSTANNTSSGTLTFAASGSPSLTVSGAVTVGSNGNAGRTGTITFTSGSTLTVGSLALAGSGTTPAAGTITMTAGGTLRTGGAITIGTGTATWTPGTGTVVLTAPSTLPATIFTSFYNLTINHGGTTTLGVSTSILANGTLTQTSGNIAVGTYTLTVNGTHSATATPVVSGAGGYTLASGATLATANANGVGGTITTTTATLNTGANYTFNGAGGQITSTTMPATVNNLTIGNTASVTLSQGTTVGGTLNVGDGTTFTVGAFALTVTGATTVGGATSGTLAITSATGAKALNGGVTINAGGTLDQGCSSALTIGGTFSISGAYTNCAAGSSASNNLTTGAVTVNSGGLFSYIGTGTVTLGGNFTNNGTAQLWGGSYQAGGQQPVCASAFLTLSASAAQTWSAGGTYILENIKVDHQTGTITSFQCYGCAQASASAGNGGSWATLPTSGTSSCAGAPTLVSFHSFSAVPQGGGVLLKWRSGREVANLGYHIYRDGVRITSSPVAGSALLAGPATVLTAGNSYTWFDPQGTTASKYDIEDLDLNGARTKHGPLLVDAVPTSITGVRALAAEGGRFSPLLSQLGRAGAGNELSFTVTAPETEEAPPAGASEASRPNAQGVRRHGKTPAAPRAAPSAINQQYALAAGQAVKLGVRHEGWYHVDASQLTAAGMPAGVDPDNLQLFAEGGEQAMVVLGAGRVSAIEFYGTGLDTTFSDTRVYWLVWNSKHGSRVQSDHGQAAHGTPPTSFPATLEWRPRTLYFPALVNGDADNFFGPVLDFADPVKQPLTVANLNPATAGSSMLQVTMQGVTAGAHAVVVQLNGTELGTMRLSDQDNSSSTFAVPNSLLHEGANTLALATYGPNDVTVVDNVLLTYPSSYTANGDYLRFTAPSGSPVTVGGFTGKQIQVVDITDPSDVVSLAGSIAAQETGFAVTVAPGGRGTRILLALTAAQESQPWSITAHHPSSWHAAQPGADMVIISHAAFLPTLGPLQALRRAQGHTVAAVDVQDLYDEFNFGEQSPYAIKTFLSTANKAWKSKPHWVLLVGDATYDPRNYLGAGRVDYLPVELIGTSQLETSSDDWFVDLNDDGSPEMAIGRLPVDSPAAATAMVGKIVAYEQAGGAPWKSRALLVSGANDSDNTFEKYTAALQAMLPKSMTVTTILQGSDPNAANDLTAAFNSGQSLVNYFGHGSTEIWKGGLFSSTAADAVTNGSSTPFVVSMTCLNGYFQDVFTVSLAEALMQAPGGGAVAVWASSGLTDSAPQSALNQSMIGALFGAAPMTVGDAALAAKQTVSDLDVRRTWILFGDPAMRLR